MSETSAGFGSCCACGRAVASVRNVVPLPKLAPVAGTGWGCEVCGLPLNGAVAVVCDNCLACQVEVKWAVYGPLWEKGRVLVGMLTGAFNHRMEFHMRGEYRVQ